MNTAFYQENNQDLARLVKIYDIEKYLFEDVSERFKEQKTLSPYDFFAIITWKSNRAKTKVKRGLIEARETVGALMRQVAEAPTPLSKVKTLTQIWGIGLPIASAVLAVCYPNEFTVLDYRAWGTLQKAAVKGLPSRRPSSVDEYLQYCQACREFAAQLGLSLRDLDRALWAKSWEDDLLKLIDK